MTTNITKPDESTSKYNPTIPFKIGPHTYEEYSNLNVGGTKEVF